MPDLNERQAGELVAALNDAALLPSQRLLVPVLCWMAAADPVTAREANTLLLVDLILGDPAYECAAFEIVGRALAGGARPDGLVVPLGTASGDPMMLLARDVIQMSVRGEPSRAWETVRQAPPGRRAAVLSLLLAFLNYRFAGLDPVALAAAE